jgi:cytochrome c6
MKRLLLSAARNLTGGAILFSALLFAGRASAQSPAAANFKAKCAMCHGADGKGDTPVGKINHIKDLTSADVQKQKDDELIRIITTGKDKMPSFGGKLKPEEMKGLVDYIRTLGKGK